LIPKDISILRIVAEPEVVGPGSALGIDIDGSGFTREFEQMIRLESGSPDVRVQSAHLVTANQIHAELAVGAAAKTAYVYPGVMIQGLPVFRAATPFGVVRPGEVLDIKLAEVSEDGRAYRFRVITNIDEKMARRFQVEPTMPGLKVKALQPHLPYVVEGVLRIDHVVQGGDFGLAVSLSAREIFRRDKLARLALPDLGRGGLTHGISAPDPFRRPGDEVRLVLTGTGFAPEDAGALAARIPDLDAAPPTVSYVSSSEIRFVFHIPATAAERSYGVKVAGADGRDLQQVQDAFTVVPPLWLAGVQATPTPSPGRKSTLRISGRDLTPEFAQSLRVTADDSGIQFSDVVFEDRSTLAAEMTLSPAVAPGDYWLHLSAGGKPVQPRFGSLIKVTAGR